MKIENKTIHTLSYKEILNVDSLHISKSIINTLDLTASDPSFEIFIENSIIENLLIHSCWFRKGLIFKDNHVTNYIDYQIGGHNNYPIIIIGNIFKEFINFFDCHFEDKIEMKANIFMQGCNLLGNLDEGFKNTFAIKPIIKDNIGKIDIDGFGTAPGNVLD